MSKTVTKKMKWIDAMKAGKLKPDMEIRTDATCDSTTARMFDAIICCIDHVRGRVFVMKEGGVNYCPEDDCKGNWEIEKMNKEATVIFEEKEVKIKGKNNLETMANALASLR